MRSLRKFSGQLTTRTTAIKTKHDSFEGYDKSYSSCCSHMMTIHDDNIFDDTDQKHVQIEDELPLFYNPKSFTVVTDIIPIQDTAKALHRHPLKQFSIHNISDCDIDIQMYLTKKVTNQCSPFILRRKKSNSSDSRIVRTKKKITLSRSKSVGDYEESSNSKWSTLKDKFKNLRLKNTEKKKDKKQQNSSLLDSLPKITMNNNSIDKTDITVIANTTKDEQNDKVSYQAVQLHDSSDNEDEVFDNEIESPTQLIKVQSMTNV